jgi:hypothetical protein
MSDLELVVPEKGRKQSESNPEYQEYLRSARWLKVRRAVMLRAKGKCEICRRWEGKECAHLTYERLFHEHLEDLLWLCPRCHRELDLVE